MFVEDYFYLYFISFVEGPSHVVSPIVVLIFVVVGPSCRADEVAPLALLIYLAHACDFDDLLVAGADEDSGGLEEKCSGLHLDYFKAELVVIDHYFVGRHRHWLGRHRVVVYCFVVGLEPDVIVLQQGREVKIVLLLLYCLIIRIVLLNLVLELHHRLLVKPVLYLNLKTQQIDHLPD